MQLFILDRNCRQAAEYLADIHLIKMCLETAQILSSVICMRNLVLPPEFPKPYNPHHPVIRAIQTPAQTAWVTTYNTALHREYRFRFDKFHAYYPICGSYCDLLQTNGIEPECLGLARVFNKFHTGINDIVDAHRAYYRHKMDILKHPPAWSRRPVPEVLKQIL